MIKLLCGTLVDLGWDRCCSHSYGYPLIIFGSDVCKDEDEVGGGRGFYGERNLFGAYGGLTVEVYCS